MIGTGLLVYDFIDTVNEANQAYQRGDSDYGNKLVRDWICETAGGFVTADVFMKTVAPLALAFGTCGGPLGIAVGIALEIGAGVIGYAVGSQIGQFVSDFIDELFSIGEDSIVRRIDPIVLDLDGDGVETTGLKDGTYFDLDNNGFEEKSGWVASDDGLLAMDRNNDGKINAGKELFGDQTVLEDGTIASSGFMALQDLDENGDGIIDHNDSMFEKLRVWRDLDQDGQSSEQELFTLEEIGIKSLNLSYNDQNTEDANGNIIARVGSYEKTDGTTGDMNEYLLSRDTKDTIAQEPIDTEINSEIAKLPEIYMQGNIHSLRQAMMRDSSKELKTLIENFINETDAQDRNDMMDTILFKWAETSHIDPSSRGNDFDARKLAVLEKFNGRTFVGTTGNNPIAEAVPHLTKAYNRLAESIYCKLLFQTHMNDFFKTIDIQWNFITNHFSIDFVKAKEAIEERTNENFNKGMELLGEFCRIIKDKSAIASPGFEDFRKYFADKSEIYAAAMDLSGLDAIVGGSENDVLNGSDKADNMGGGEGDDTLSGGMDDDLIYGQEGNDTIYGGSGEDVLIGGKGNDKIYGYQGNDTYIFNVGDGIDTLYDYDWTSGNVDRILLGEGIGASDLTYMRNGNDLEISIGTNEDKIIIDYFFYSDKNKIEKLEFSDGTTIDLSTIEFTTIGNEEDNIIRGWENADTLGGGKGNDKIYGYQGNDTYIFNVGDGIDTLYDYDWTSGNVDRILLGEGIGASDLTYMRNGNDLEISIGTNEDKIIIDYFFYSDKNKIEKLEFSDGTTIDLSTIEFTIIGNEEDNIIKGWDSADTLGGGKGNDKIYGYQGNDTYIFNVGDGIDTLYDYDWISGNVDRILLGEGIGASDLTYMRNGNDLEISIGTNEDKIIIDYFFYSDKNKIEKLEFSDGTTIDLSTIEFTTIGNEEDNIIRGWENADTLGGGKGNDKLCGYQGNDTYIFNVGDGIDTIYDYDSTSGNIDTIDIDFQSSELIIEKNGYDLDILINDSSDKIIVSSWFTSSSYHTENIKTNDGKILMSNQVNQLIEAMSSFCQNNGISSWSEALSTRENEVQNVISQYFTTTISE